MADKIAKVVEEIVASNFKVKIVPQITIPEEQFGDFTSNVAMQIAGKLQKKPYEIAESIANSLQNLGYEASVAGPGFVNIRVQDEELIDSLVNQPDRQLEGQSWVVEYSCPNYFKELHAGHLYQTLFGDVIARLIERAGADVHRVTFGADVGLSAARAIWGILQFLGGEYPEKLAEIPVEERTKFIASRYVDGAKADSVDNDEKAQKEIAEINKRIYEMHASGDTESAFARVYFECRGWCKDYFLRLYEMLKVDEFEKYYPESSTERRGKETVRANLPNVFKESDGAIVFEGEQFGLHTRVFINSAGLPTYEAKDIGLILIEKDDFAFDRRVLVTGNEQAEYMKVVWRAIDQIEPGVEAQMTHLTNGIIRFGDGKKMSSRLGNVTSAVDVVNTVRELVGDSGDKDRDEKIALGALKYEFMKYRLGGDIAFDPQESVSLQGNSGPYLQYALVRARSILSKSEMRAKPTKLDSSERSLARALVQFEEKIQEATRDYQPHVLCTYLYDLAGIFNKFYEVSRVVGDEREAQRLYLVESYSNTLYEGLKLLGIEAPEKM